MRFSPQRIRDIKFQDTYRKVLRFTEPLSVKKEFNQYGEINKKDVISNHIVRADNQHHRIIKNAIIDINRDKVCKSRSKRRKIMFSKGKAGKGKTGPKNRKYTENSKVRC